MSIALDDNLAKLEAFKQSNAFWPDMSHDDRQLAFRGVEETLKGLDLNYNGRGSLPQPELVEIPEKKSFIMQWVNPETDVRLQVTAQTFGSYRNVVMGKEHSDAYEDWDLILEGQVREELDWEDNEHGSPTPMGANFSLYSLVDTLFNKDGLLPREYTLT